MSDDSYQTAYDKHWSRLAALLGIEEAAAERARMTADKKADRRRKRIMTFRLRLPDLRQNLAKAERDSNVGYAKKLEKWIAYREQAIADYEEETGDRRHDARPEDA